MGHRIENDRHLWSSGVLPYTINEGDFPRLSTERFELDQAIDRISTRTNITLLPRTDEHDYVEFVRWDTSCRTPEGRQGGRQEIRCARFEREWFMHEILHAAGFLHEHQRWDREDFVYFREVTGQVEPGHMGDFATRGDGFPIINPNIVTDGVIGPTGYEGIQTYDYISLLHYNELFYSADGEPLFDLPANVTPPLGNDDLSDEDIRCIAAVYPMKAAPFAVGKECRGAALAAGPITGPGGDDIMVGFIRSAFDTESVFLAIAEGVQYRGYARRWTDPFQVDFNQPDGSRLEGLGVAVGDVDGDGQLEVVVGVLRRTKTQTVGVYKVGSALDGRGIPTTWSAEWSLPGADPATPPNPAANPRVKHSLARRRHAGVALFDVDGDGRDEIIFLTTFEDGLADGARYQVGFGFDPMTGWTTWSSFNVDNLMAGHSNGADIFVRPNGEMILHFVENPSGPNRGWHKWNGRMKADGSTGPHAATWFPLEGWMGNRQQGAGYSEATFSLHYVPTLTRVRAWIDHNAGANYFVYRMDPMNLLRPSLVTIGTTDAADVIEVLVEPGMSPPLPAIVTGAIEFRLSVRPDVDWWKALAFTMQAGNQFVAQTYDDVRSKATQYVGFGSLDLTRGIEFHKARALGLHMMVGAVFGLPPGSLPFGITVGDRATFTWLRA